MSIALMAMSFIKPNLVDDIILTGNIKNSTNKKLTVSGLTLSYSKIITLNEDGSFDAILNTEAGHYMIYDGKYVTYFYAEKGDKIILNIDLNDYKKTIKFTGNSSEINNYLVDKRGKEKEIIGEIQNAFKLDEVEFLKTQNNIKTGLLAFLSNYKNLPSKYVEKEKNNIINSYLSSLNDYEFNHGYYTNQKDFKTSSDFLKELKALDYNNEENYKFSYAYYSLVNSHYKNVAANLSKSEAIPLDVALMKSLHLVSNNYIRNSLLYKNAKNGITYTEDLEDYYTAFMHASTNEAHQKEITSSYTELRNVTKGKSSPKFIGYENNAGGKMSLDDLKGKYVYIDVWATWCGPCKAEIPHLKEVEKKYHGKNIEFVSISVDKIKDHAKWKKMIMDENLGGIQLLADNAFESKFIKDYFIKGIPRFILLDPNGTIVTPNAPRPSNEALIQLFNKLNI